jgi:hypothetical protein
MPPLDLDAQVLLSDIRARVLRREPISPSEYRDLITDLRRGYAAAARNSSAARSRKPAGTAAKSSSPAFDLDTVFPGN